MIDPAKVAFFVPSNLKKFKLDLFNRIAATIQRAGGKIVRGDVQQIGALAAEGWIPIVGCSPELTNLITGWRAQKKTWIYWDRGYWLRVFKCGLPTGQNGGTYRWHVGSFQAQRLLDVTAARWERDKTTLGMDIVPWKKNGRHIVIAQPTETYARFHHVEGWTDETIERLAQLTDRQLVIRGKQSKRHIQADLDGAHCLVAHGSNAAVEAAFLGCPVFVDKCSAAALVGLTDLSQVERPIYPDRAPWVRTLASSHFYEPELTDGNLWRLLS